MFISSIARRKVSQSGVTSSSQRDGSRHAFLFRSLLFLHAVSLIGPTGVTHGHARSSVSRGISKNQYRHEARGGAAKKSSISRSPPIPFYLFHRLYGFLCNAESRSLRSPQGGSVGYSNQLDLQGREFTEEVGTTASARGHEHRRSAGEFIFSEA